MPSPPSTPAERYLDVLRTLGVTDAAIRRFHDVDPAASLEAMLSADLTSPTDDLIALLAAAGVVVDLEEVAPVDADRLALSLARFGYLVECSAVGDDIEIVGFDAVTEDVEHLRAEPDREALRAALSERLLNPDDVAVTALTDGRTLVADRRALDALCSRYGPRIEPFETPLLAAERDVDASATPPMLAQTTSPSADESPIAFEPADPVERPAADGDATTTDGPAPLDADGPGGEVDVEEVLETADEETEAAIEETLTASGPRVSTAEGTDEDVEAARESGIGGGPRRTVSTKGIDDVFAQLEATAATPTEGSDAMDDDSTATTEEPDDDREDGLAGGAPSRTVSDTSVDDILQRATGAPDFDELAETEADADPDAVLAEADETVPGVEADADDHESSPADTDPPDDGRPDGRGKEADEEPTPPSDADQAPASDGGRPTAFGSAGSSRFVDAAGDDGSASTDEPASDDRADGSTDDDRADETTSDDRSDATASEPAAASDDRPPVVTAERDGGGPTVEAADGTDVDAATASLARLSGARDGEGESRNAGDQSTVEPTPSGESDSSDGTAASDADGADDPDDQSGAPDAAASAFDASSDGSSSTPDGSADADGDDGRPALGEDLLEDDAEVAEGTGTVDVDPSAIPDHDPDPDDGPLAAAGGVAPATVTDAPTAADSDDGENGDDATSDDGGGFLARLRSLLGL